MRNYRYRTALVLTALWLLLPASFLAVVGAAAVGLNAPSAPRRMESIDV